MNVNDPKVGEQARKIMETMNYIVRTWSIIEERASDSISRLWHLYKENERDGLGFYIQILHALNVIRKALDVSNEIMGEREQLLINNYYMFIDKC